MVPFRLDETGINDLTQTPDHGRLLPGQAPHHLGRAHAGRDRHGDEDGAQPPLQPRRAAGAQPQHGARGQLRRQHRAAPERHHQHQHPHAAPREACRPAGPTPSSATSSTSTPTCRTPTTRSRRRWCGGPRGASGTWCPTPSPRASRPRTTPSVGGNTRTREGDLALRRPPQPRPERRLGAAGRPRQALPRRRGRRDAGPPRRMADAGHRHPAQRAAVHAHDRGGPGQHRRRGSAAEPRGLRRPGRPDGGEVVRPAPRSPCPPSSPTATRAPTSCARTGTRTSTSRCSSASAARSSSASSAST